MSQWGSNYAVLRDPGRGVPVRIDGVIAGDEKYLPLHIPEERPEHEYGHYMRHGADTGTSPDVNFIQHMLDLVHLDQPAPQQRNTSTSMLNPNCAEFVPNYSPSFDINDNRYCNDKNNRNVALKSLRKVDNHERFRMHNMPLLKPEDIIHNKTASQRDNVYFLSTQPYGLHKRSLENLRSNVTPMSPPEPNNNIYAADMYEPSEFAEAYYNMYMERAMARNYLKEHIWFHAEKQMQEVEKRKEEAIQIANEWTLKQQNPNINLVRLPYHRHAIPGECIVCTIVQKHNFSIKKFLSAEKRV